MPRNVRLSKQLAAQIKQAATSLDDAQLPANAHDAHEILLELHAAIEGLRAPIRALIEVVAAGDEEKADLPALADSRLRRLGKDILHALGED